jgi:hypothetical protein
MQEDVGLLRIIHGDRTDRYVRRERPEDIPEGAARGIRAVTTDVYLFLEQLCEQRIGEEMDLEMWRRDIDKDAYDMHQHEDAARRIVASEGRAYRRQKGLEYAASEAEEPETKILLEIDVNERKILLTPFAYRALEEEARKRVDAALGKLARFGFTVNYSMAPEHQPFRGLCRARDI